MEQKCPVCACSSDSADWMQIHCVKAHPKQFYTCPWCITLFGSLPLLQKHATNCLEYNVDAPREGRINSVLVNNDKCLECEGRFDSTDSAIKHYKEQHLNFVYVCKKCGMDFQHNANLEAHCAAHPPIPSASTDSNYSSASTVNIDGSYGNGASASVISASMKRFDFKGQDVAYKRQAMKLLKEKHCVVCQIDFASIPEIVMHFETTHKTTVFTCDICTCAYVFKSSFSAHRRKKHRDEVNQMRNNRNAQVTTSQNRTINEAQASANHICPMCGSQFTSNSTFAEHLLGHMAPSERRVKSENGNEVGVSSTSAIRTTFKQEPDWLNTPRAKRPEPTFDGTVVDLTGDD